MNKKEILFGLLLVAILAIALSPFASPWPDGLEKVAEDLGFIQKAEVEPVINSPIPDYAWPNLKSEKLATSVAGISGALVVFALGYGLALLLKSKS